MPGPHDKIIADAAKAALGPLNFRRKGRSRTWFADCGWWVLVVEFQPSAWSKGSYLNVAAHWLWSQADYLSFDFGGRVTEFEEYLSDEQFMPTAVRLSENAARQARRLTQTFLSLSMAADVLLSEERATRKGAEGGWMAYHAGVAAGLVGRTIDAAEMFDRVLSQPALRGSVLHSVAERMAVLAAESSQLRDEVVSQITRRRNALRLPVLATPLL